MADCFAGTVLHAFASRRLLRYIRFAFEYKSRSTFFADSASSLSRCISLEGCAHDALLFFYPASCKIASACFDALSLRSPDSHLIMQFHSSVLGANVQLDDDNLTANRKDKLSFCNGVVFSSTHLIPNTPVSLTIKSIDLEWRGSFSVGLLVRDPVEYFKDNAIPKILQPLEGVMRVKTTPPSWANCRIILMVTFTRDLIVFIDDGPPQIFFNKLHAEDDRFWLALDVFGRTNCISFTNFDESRSQIPMDIALLGPQTIVAYKTACKEASVPYNQGRVFFIGPYGAGKTSLKRSLLGLS